MFSSNVFAWKCAPTNCKSEELDVIVLNIKVQFTVLKYVYLGTRLKRMSNKNTNKEKSRYVSVNPNLYRGPTYFTILGCRIAQ